MRVLRTVLVAPSRYDEKGVIVYRIGIGQDSSLGALTGLIRDYNRRHAGTAEIRYEIFDEHVIEAVQPALLRRWRDDAARHGERFLLMVCGVQTVNYPRARDIALMARREGITVIAGGVHLSAHGPSTEFLATNGVSVGIGEVEPIWDRIIGDALDGTLAAVYRLDGDEGRPTKTAISDIRTPDLSDLPYPYLAQRDRSRYANRSQLNIDSSRGCPYMCSFCTVKNLFGRTVRSRDPDKFVAWVAERVDNDGIRLFPFTDDNFLRNPRHLEILEGLARLRAGGRRFRIDLILDVESSCYVEEDSPRGERTRRFLDLCQAAGVTNVFLGLESTNDATLQEMRKSVNRDRGILHQSAPLDPALARAEAHRAIVARYRAAVRGWHSIGASVECGYLFGFAADGKGAGMQAARDLREIGVDVVGFSPVVPLPGAEDYARAVTQGTLLEHDFNEYFRNRAIIAHPTMTPTEVEEELRTAVQHFHSLGSVCTRLLRGLLGIGRPRVSTPWIFARRQIGLKMMMRAGRYSYHEGGLLRRRSAVRREAITDEEARVHFLGPEMPQRVSGLPPATLYDDQMESLPILSRHEIGSGVPVEPRGSFVDHSPAQPFAAGA